MKPKLLASAPTMLEILQCIADFYAGNAKRLGRVDGQVLPAGPWDVLRQDGTQVPGVRVVLKRGRYRFEAV